MRRFKVLILVHCIGLLFAGLAPVQAQCVLPHTLVNGQPTDATQVMANFNALLSCLAPGGSTNAIQYNAGTGSLAGVGPLTDGQVVIGSTGAAPQAQTLTAGAGISITNGAGSITIASTGGAPLPPGLYNQVMSATPTSAATALTNWLNQGTSTVTDSAVGVCINAPTSGTSPNVIGRIKAVPTPPYTITALIAATRNSTSNNGVGIGWYDGSSKLHVISYPTNAGAAPIFQVNKFSSVTVLNGTDFTSASNAFSQPVWLQIKDDGTNVSFAFSQEGANFIPVFTVAKSSGYLGASGYANLIFFVNPQGSQTLGTLMSWTES